MAINIRPHSFSILTVQDATFRHYSRAQNKVSAENVNGWNGNSIAMRLLCAFVNVWLYCIINWFSHDTILSIYTIDAYLNNILRYLWITFVLYTVGRVYQFHLGSSILFLGISAQTMMLLRREKKLNSNCYLSYIDQSIHSYDMILSDMKSTIWSMESELYWFFAPSLI